MRVVTLLVYFALGRICSGEEFTLGRKTYLLRGFVTLLLRICSGEKKKIGKKGEMFANFSNNGENFGKIGGV
jgi:hypothetical protein